MSVGGKCFWGGEQAYPKSNVKSLVTPCAIPSRMLLVLGLRRQQIMDINRRPGLFQEASPRQSIRTTTTTTLLPADPSRLSAPVIGIIFSPRSPSSSGSLTHRHRSPARWVLRPAAALNHLSHASRHLQRKITSISGFTKEISFIRFLAISGKTFYEIQRNFGFGNDSNNNIWTTNTKCQLEY